MHCQELSQTLLDPYTQPLFSEQQSRINLVRIVHSQAFLAPVCDCLKPWKGHMKCTAEHSGTSYSKPKLQTSHNYLDKFAWSQILAHINLYKLPPNLENTSTSHKASSFLSPSSTQTV